MHNALEAILVDGNAFERMTIAQIRNLMNLCTVPVDKE